MPDYQWAVVLADLDPVRGSEQRGVRPAVVVSNEDYNQRMRNVTVLPLTTAERPPYPAEMVLPSGAGGQQRDSVVLAHQIRTISKERIVRFLGHVTDARLQHLIRQAMVEHLDLEDELDPLW